MEALSNRLYSLALQNTRQLPSRRKSPLPLRSFRTIYTTPIYRRQPPFQPPPPPPPPSSESKFNYDELVAEDRREYDRLSPEDKAVYRDEYIALEEHMNSPGIEEILETEVSNAASDIQHEFYQGPERREIQNDKGFMTMGEPDYNDTEPEEEFKGDDITSLGHGELEQHREKREYARIAAWDMPMLSKLAKPFTLPALDQPLRFRYTNYMGETHPAANKIVLEFCTADLPDLTPAQRAKLIKLVGVRYNPQTDNVKMSCEMFETQAQNKRYLGDLVDSLVAEAKNPEDMYEDVPFDFRHHKFTKKLKFPDAWKMTRERKAELAQERDRKALQEGEREEAGQIPDGVAIINETVKSNLRSRVQSYAVLEEKGKGGSKGRGKLVR